MSVPPEQFARIAGRVNLDLLGDRLVVIVGVGAVGSLIAEELANSGVGRLRMIDGDVLEVVNLVRHTLPRRYLHMNKAKAMERHLSEEVPTLQATAQGRYIDEQLDDDELDSLLEEADLIVAATGEDNTQRRLGRRALALDIPAIFPALYSGEGGEVFVQRSPLLPCFLCWDAARPVSEPLHGVTALKADTLGIIQLAVYLSIGVLDSESSYAGLFLPPRSDPRPRQLFIQNEFGLAISAVDRRPNCPACRVGPALQPRLPIRPMLPGRVLPSDGTPTTARNVRRWYEGLDSNSVIVSLGLVLAALVFLACPFFIMTVLLPDIGVIHNGQPSSIWANLFLLVVGPGCALWAFAGLAVVVISVWRLLVAIFSAVTKQVDKIGIALLLVFVAGLVFMLIEGDFDQPSLSVADCTQLRCFTRHFARCSSAEYDPGGAGSTSYRIFKRWKGEGSDRRKGCIVRMDNPRVKYFPQMRGHALACVFDNKMGFRQAKRDVLLMPREHLCADSQGYVFSPY